MSLRVAFLKEYSLSELGKEFKIEIHGKTTLLLDGNGLCMNLDVVDDKVKAFTAYGKSYDFDFLDKIYSKFPFTTEYNDLYWQMPCGRGDVMVDVRYDVDPKCEGCKYLNTNGCTQNIMQEYYKSKSITHDKYVIEDSNKCEDDDSNIIHDLEL